MLLFYRCVSQWFSPDAEYLAFAGRVVDNTDVELREIREPDIHFVPTPQDVVEKMLELAEVEESDLVYDLGCGDGRIVITAAKKYGCRGVGFDIDPERVVDSLNNVKINKVGHLVRIVQRDVFTLDLSDASVITLLSASESECQIDSAAEKTHTRHTDCFARFRYARSKTG